MSYTDLVLVPRSTIVMRYRRKMSKRISRRVFRKGANRIHKKNVRHLPVMRGGIRL